MSVGESLGGRLVLDIRGAKVAFDSRYALDGATMQVKQGDMVGIVGPNGSGKSTLLKAITNVLTLASGEVLVEGETVESIPRRSMAQKVAVVEQNTDIRFDFSVREVVAMGRLPRQRFMAGESAEDRRAVESAMDLTHTRDFATRSIRSLSGGERQRVLLARALAQDTRILLLDEPTSHLDIGSQVEIMDLVRHLCLDQGTTVVAVLHDLNLAAQYCDWLALMRLGRVHACGPPASVITEAALWEVYGVRAQVNHSPLTGRPYVLALSGCHEAQPSGTSAGLKVHVVCGGGSGEPVLRALNAAGCQVTAGVLNLLDSDEDACHALGIPVISEAPFSPISDERLTECMQAVGSCEVVVVCPVPFAAGNLRNLELAQRAQAAGKRVILMSNSLPEWDFTGGLAKAAIDAMAIRGAVSVATVAEAVAAVNAFGRGSS